MLFVLLTADFRDIPKSVGYATDLSGPQDYGLQGCDAV
jgi:hypothetical protein